MPNPSCAIRIEYQNPLQVAALQEISVADLSPVLPRSGKSPNLHCSSLIFYRRAFHKSDVIVAIETRSQGASYLARQRLASPDLDQYDGADYRAGYAGDRKWLLTQAHHRHLHRQNCIGTVRHRLRR